MCVCGSWQLFLTFCCTSHGNSQVSRTSGKLFSPDGGGSSFSGIIVMRFGFFAWGGAAHCVGTLRESWVVADEGT